MPVVPYGLPMGDSMGSATGFNMGLIWVSPYAGCPDGSHMGLISQPHKENSNYINIFSINTPIKRSDAQPLIEREKQFECRPVEISKS